jgi:hypothetical protein
MAGSLPVLMFHALEDWPPVISLSPHVFCRSLVVINGAE